MRLTRNLVYLSLFLGASAALAQEATVPRLDLKVRDEIELPHTFAPMTQGDARCDSQGNIYIQPYQLVKPMSAPILRLSSDGNDVTRLNLTTAPGFEKSGAIDFTVGLHGEVIFLTERMVEAKAEIDLVTFNDDGEYETTTKLEPEFSPSKFALFTNGEILVTGIRHIKEEQIEESSTYTAVVDASGRLVKEVTLPGDVAREKRDYSKPMTEAQKRHAPLEEVGLSEVSSGEDGNVYLMRHTMKPKIAMIAGTGEVVRDFTIIPPREDATAWEMKYGTGGKLIVHFAVPAEKKERGADMILSVFNAEAGERELDYWAKGDVRGTFACYAPSGFTFLGQSKNDAVTIKRVAAQ